MFALKVGAPSVNGLRGAAIAISISFLAAAPSFAQDDKGPMDEKALSTLKAMSDYLRSADTVSFRTKAFFDVVRESGIKIKTGRASTVMIKRPNHLHVEAVGDDGYAITAWFDGKKLTVWRRTANEVMHLEFSGSTDQMLDHLVEKHEVQLPLADILYSDLDSTFRDNLVSAEYIGLRTVDGVPCHQLSFESTGADWQIWIEADSTPVPRRYAIDFVTLEHKPQFLAQFDAWSINPEIDDSLYEGAVPQGVNEVQFKPRKPGDAQ